MQPHFPYIPVMEEKGWFEQLRAMAGKVGNKLVGRSLMNTLRTFLGTKGQIGMREKMRSIGENDLKKGYRMNLKLALSEAETLARKLPGRVVVTSDHGEFLGEEGKYGHYKDFDHPILRNVPWLEVKE